MRLWSLRLASRPQMAVDGILVRDEMTYRDKVISSLTKAVAMAMPGAADEAI